MSLTRLFFVLVLCICLGACGGGGGTSSGNPSSNGASNGANSASGTVTNPGGSSPGNTSAGNTSSDNTSAGNTSAGNTSAGNTSSGNTSSGNTSAGNTSSGNTSSGNTSAGNTSSGNTSSGNTSSGNTSAGNTSSGNTSAGNTSAGNTSSGNTSSGNISAGNTGGGNVSSTGSIEIRSILARAVPNNVDELRFTGRDSRNVVLYGPTTFPKASLILLTPVSTSVVWLQIEYLSQGNLVGSFTGPVNVPAGGAAMVEDPQWQDVAAHLVSLQITPPGGTVAAGLTLQVRAVGVFSDNSTQDLTQSVTWAVSDSSLANVAGGLVEGIKPGAITVTATQGLIRGQAGVEITAAQLLSLQVSGKTNVAAGLTTLLQVQGNFSDGSHQDLTSQASWSISPITLASFLTPGQIQGLQAGQGTINVTIGALSVSSPFNVSDAVPLSLQVGPTAPSLAAGLTAQFNAILLLSDGTTQDVTSSATWSSSDASAATISGGGLAQSFNPGSTQITATLGALSARTSLTVSSATLVRLELTPSNATTAKGVPVQFQAWGIFTDGTRGAISPLWSSSQTGLVAIDPNSGLATALDVGSVVISAAAQGLAASANLTVGPARLTSLQILPGNPSVAVGATLPLRAVGGYSDGTSLDVSSSVTWQALDGNVVSLSPSGQAHGSQVGLTTVNASFQGITAQTPFAVVARAVQQITISPPNAQVPAGQKLRLSATAIYNDNTTMDITPLCTWTSKDLNIATISNADQNPGTLTALLYGSVGVTANYEGVEGQVSVSVIQPTFDSFSIISPNPANFPGPGLSLAFRATAHGVNLPSATPVEVTRFVVWTSLDPNVVQVSNAPGSEGLVKAIGPGQTQLQAQLDGMTRQVTITVGNSPLVSMTLQAPPTVRQDGQWYYAVPNGTFQDGSQMNLWNYVTYTSSDPSVVSFFDTTGQMLAGRAGTATVTATSASGLSASANVTSLGVELSSLILTVPPGGLLVGGKVNILATGLYSDGSRQDVTNAVVFSSSDTNVAVVDNSPGNVGQVSGLKQGSATISGRLQGKFSFVGVQTYSPVTSLDITPLDINLAIGATQQMTAIAHYQDGTSRDVTASVGWETSAVDVAWVAPNGSLEARMQGRAVISTFLFGLATNTTVTVAGPAMQSLTLSPGVDQTIPQGTLLNIQATGHYADGSSVVINRDLVWNSTHPEVVGVNFRGDIQALGLGSSTISATDPLSGLSATFQVTVGPVTFTRLSMVDYVAPVPTGVKIQTHVYADSSDHQVVEVTPSVSWQINPPTAATITPQGVLTTLGGSFTLSATYQGLTANLNYNVLTAQVVGVGYAPGTTLTIPLDTRKNLSTVLALSDGTIYVPRGSTDTLSVSSSDSSKLLLIGSGNSPKVATLGLGDVVLTLTDSLQGLTTQIVVSITN